jgi:hypothetical protein
MWSDEELSALVEYIALYHSPDEEVSSNIWPATKNDEFWGKCAEAVNCYNIGSKHLVSTSDLCLIDIYFVITQYLWHNTM